MSVLLTGGAGYIGTHTAVVLLAATLLCLAWHLVLILPYTPLHRRQVPRAKRPGPAPTGTWCTCTSKRAPTARSTGPGRSPTSRSAARPADQGLGSGLPM